MLPDDRIRLQHMLDATQAAIGFLRARDRHDLDTDTMLLFATVRALEVIGEAAGKVSDNTRSAAPQIPWRAMVGMRNRLIHPGFDSDLQISPLFGGPLQRRRGFEGGDRKSAVVARL